MDKNSGRKTAISGKISLFSIFSIIAIIIMCTAAWKALDIAKDTYLKTIKNNQKTAPKKQSSKVNKTAMNPFLSKLFVGFHLAKANVENNKDIAAIKANESKAQDILKRYAAAQEKYREFYGYYAKNATELIIEENNKLTIIDPVIKVLNSAYNKENPQNGYFYIEIVKTGPKARPASFFLSAIPAKYGISGFNTYCINEQGKIRKSNTKGHPEFDIKIINDTWAK